MLSYQIGDKTASILVIDPKVELLQIVREQLEEQGELGRLIVIGQSGPVRVFDPREGLSLEDRFDKISGFISMSGNREDERWQLMAERFWLSPFDLQKNMVRKIKSIGRSAEQGRSTRIVAKMNSLTDEALIRAPIRAGQQGVKIDLIVRGACMLPVEVPGFTANIKVRSIIGRFLEHSRVFYFRDEDTEELYLSSADWMNRNMVGRIELAWPITDPVQRQRVVDECLVAYLHDGVDAWKLSPDGSYIRVHADAVDMHSAQEALMGRYGISDR